jgi:hypothetical protein
VFAFAAAAAAAAAVVVFVMTQTGNFWIYPRNIKILLRNSLGETEETHDTPHSSRSLASVPMRMELLPALQGKLICGCLECAICNVVDQLWNNRFVTTVKEHQGQLVMRNSRESVQQKVSWRADQFIIVLDVV